MKNCSHSYFAELDHCCCSADSHCPFTARWLHISCTTSRWSISKLLCSVHTSLALLKEGGGEAETSSFWNLNQMLSVTEQQERQKIILADFSIRNFIILQSLPCFIRARPPQVFCIAAALKLLSCLARGPSVSDADMAVTDAYQKGLHFPTGTRNWTSSVPCHPLSLLADWSPAVFSQKPTLSYPSLLSYFGSPAPCGLWFYFSSTRLVWFGSLKTRHWLKRGVFCPFPW